jgi:hypothetical protein
LQWLCLSEPQFHRNDTQTMAATGPLRHFAVT